MDEKEKTMNILTNYESLVKKENPCSSLNCNCECHKSEVAKKTEYKPDILDIFSKKVINERDVNDMVTAPRAIFKGYLCFTTGTAINAIAAMIKNAKVKTGLLIAGTLASIYGTFNFVKPFLIKQENLTKSEK